MNIFLLIKLLHYRTNNPLAFRLLFYILLCSVCFTFLATIFQLYTDYHKDRDLIEARIQHIQESYVPGLSKSIWNFDNELIETQLKGILHLPDIVYLEIQDKSGQTLMTVGTPQTETIIARQFSLHYEWKDRDSEIGELYVVATLKGVYQRLREKVLVILLTEACTIFLLSICIQLIFQVFVTRHLVAMARYTRGLDVHKLDTHFTLDRKTSASSPLDELEQVVMAMNDMQRRIRTDIAKRERVEKALRENEEKFRSYIENAPNGIFIADEYGNYVEVNQAAERITGYSRAELLKMNLMELVRPEDRPIAEKHFKTVVKTGKASGDAPFMKKDGSLNYWRVDAVKLSEHRFLGFVTDITERKRAEEALRESEEKYRTLFEHLPIPVFTKNREGVYTSCNTENQRYWTINPIGRTDAELLDPETASALRDADLRVMETEDTLTLEEHLTNTPLGERQVLSRKVPLRDGSGNIVGILGASLDITERKRAEENIKTALKEKEILLRELYHRTKNNMQVISSMLALQAYTIENEEVRHIFKDIDHRIRSMALVHHKLCQSQNLSNINLREYIHDLAALLIESYASSERITLDINAEDVFVLIDTAMPCGLLLTELISNTLKHAFPGKREGRIRIELHRIDQNHLQLLVADNGIGVPADFDFRQTHTLGFQNVFALAEHQLGGEITFTVNNGLTCSMKLRDDLYEERI